VTIGRSTPVNDLPELLRPAEAAAFLNCSLGLLYELARRDPDLGVRLGRLLRIRRSKLAQLAGVRDEDRGGDDAA